MEGARVAMEPCLAGGRRQALGGGGRVDDAARIVGPQALVRLRVADVTVVDARALLAVEGQRRDRARPNGDEEKQRRSHQPPPIATPVGLAGTTAGVSRPAPE